ncbi:MAG: hypothetical protein H0T46_29480 [Deltaproteobacteria bacterium]|nr:hypothetical protein [Deltaproteobacteria bacterium]
MDIHLLHIGKTGGTTLKQMVKGAGADQLPDRRVVLHLHGTRAVDVFARDEPGAVAFFVRDPVARFVSGFNSRLRKGAPIANIPWRPAEEITFARFATPNDLAEALSSKHEVQQDRAFVAMDSLIHTRLHLTYWLRSPDYLESRIGGIAFAGSQERFTEDVGRFFDLLGVPPPIVDHAHQAPAGSSTELSDVATRNLQTWYADDFALYDWVVRRRDTWTTDRLLERDGLDGE